MCEEMFILNLLEIPAVPCKSTFPGNKNHRKDTEAIQFEGMNQIQCKSCSI